jgi:uncharacterized protein YaaN involved in tellurite resistance
MATDERPSEPEQDEELSATGPEEQLPVEIREPAVPEGVSDEEAQELRGRALDLVKQLEDVSGSKELELIDSVTSLGIQAQRNAASQLNLLKARVGEMLSDGTQGEITRDLVDLRMALNQISPHELQRSFIERVFNMIPFVGNRALRILQRIAIRYEAVGRQVTVIETKLREGRTMLQRDNVEMRKLYEQIEGQQLSIQKNAYMGELLMERLSGLVERAEDPLKKERLRNGLHDVSMRVQDLRTMEQVHIQFFVSLEMSRQNNTRLGQSVERTVSLATNVVTVGLAIQSALSRQKRVMEATQRTREYLGNLIAANASSIKQHTEEIGDLYNNPVIAMDKITQAHSDLIEAMDTADRLKQEGIETARENIAKLTELSSELDQRSRGLRDQAEGAPQSVEV